MFCRNIVGNVERRVIAAFLAAVVSLCATHAVPLRDSRSENIPVVIRLVESRCEKAIERKNASLCIVVRHFTPTFTVCPTGFPRRRCSPSSSCLAKSASCEIESGGCNASSFAGLVWRTRFFARKHSADQQTTRRAVVAERRRSPPLRPNPYGTD